MQWIKILFQVCPDISYWWDWTLQMSCQCYREDATATCYTGKPILSNWLWCYVAFLFSQASSACFEVWIFYRPVRAFWIQAKVKQVKGGLWLPCLGKEMQEIETTRFVVVVNFGLSVLEFLWLFYVKIGGLAWIVADTTGKAFGKLCHGNSSGDSLTCSPQS